NRWARPSPGDTGPRASRPKTPVLQRSVLPACCSAGGRRGWEGGGSPGQRHAAHRVGHRTTTAVHAQLDERAEAFGEREVIRALASRYSGAAPRHHPEVRSVAEGTGVGEKETHAD